MRSPLKSKSGLGLCRKIYKIFCEKSVEELVDTKGYFILPRALFCNVRKKAPQDENLNETLEKVFRNIESSAQGHDSEDDLKGCLMILM